MNIIYSFFSVLTRLLMYITFRNLTVQNSSTFWKNILLYAFFWVIPRRLEFICRRFGTLCPFHLHRHLPAYEDGTECSETSAYKLLTPENYPKESIQHTEPSESLKSRRTSCIDKFVAKKRQI